MKVVVLYRPNSEHGRVTEEFMHNLQARADVGRVEIISVDSREGSALATLYDIMQYPAIMVTQTDGSVMRSWEGDVLPLIDEVAAYARA